MGNPETKCTYYEQYCIDNDYFRLGECVHVHVSGRRGREREGEGNDVHVYTSHDLYLSFICPFQPPFLTQVTLSTFDLTRISRLLQELTECGQMLSKAVCMHDKILILLLNIITVTCIDV